jgi:hypothetical protein
MLFALLMLTQLEQLFPRQYPRGQSFGFCNEALLDSSRGQESEIERWQFRQIRDYDLRQFRICEVR